MPTDNFVISETVIFIIACYGTQPSILRLIIDSMALICSLAFWVGYVEKFF